MKKEYPQVAYKIAIVIATAIWGLSFVFMKDAVEILPPAWLLGFRFCAAGLILFVVLHRRVIRGMSRSTLAMGMVLGLFDFLAFLLQTIGLAHTTPGINAFLTATYCVIVPFAWWVIGRLKPTLANIGAAAIAIAGVWLVSVNGTAEHFEMGFGEGMTLMCAVVFAVHIVLVSKFAQRADALVLTVIQFLTEGCLGLLIGAATEQLPPTTALTPELLGSMVFLVVFASVVAFGIQNVALAHVPPAQAALLLSLESVFGVIASIVLYGEQITVRLLFGFALIFVAILVSEVLPMKLGKVRPKRETES